MQNLRKILLPFAWIYGVIVRLRNKFFDWGIITSRTYDFPVICVGNLSAGGTGKSPMIEYLISFLKQDYRVATLSRGYKRSTKGFYLLQGNETAALVGDEPLQFKSKFPGIEVAVDEDRQHGIATLRTLVPQPKLILLDDAFQHRKVNPGLSILLTAYNELYSNDCLLPAGNLREPKVGAKRATLIIVTKCPSKLSKSKQEKITRQLAPLPHQSVFFSTICYATFASSGTKKIDLLELPKFTLVTGIAKPKFLIDHLAALGLNFETMTYPDHHNFSPKEIAALSKKDFILTTEKDFMRLKGNLSQNKLFYIPIHIGFLAKEETFQAEITQFLQE